VRLTRVEDDQFGEGKKKSGSGGKPVIVWRREGRGNLRDRTKGINSGVKTHGTAQRTRMTSGGGIGEGERKRTKGRHSKKKAVSRTGKDIREVASNSAGANACWWGGNPNKGIWGDEMVKTDISRAAGVLEVKIRVQGGNFAVFKLKKMQNDERARRRWEKCVSNSRTRRKSVRK